MRLVLAALLVVGRVSAQEPPAAPPPVDFQQQIAPILVARCIECHGPDEQEGDLRLDQKAYLFPEGREIDWSVVPKEPDESGLLHRITLPADDDDVMPAKGEPLTKEQQQLFRRWIAEGAPWPETADAWIAAELAAKVLPKITFALPAIDEAQRAAIDAAAKALRARGAVVQQVAADTEALDVNLSLLRADAVDADLELLLPLAPRLVWLNVSRTAGTAAGLERLGRLVQLRRLHAAGTAAGDALLEQLGGLVHLEYLNLHGTAVSDAGLAAVAKLPALRRLYLWQTKVTAAAAAELRAQRPELLVDLGDYVEARLRAAEQEIAERAARDQPVNAVCPVADKPVDPAHVLEHDGRRVGFCCAKCKAAFQKEPARYAGKLPPAK